METIRFTNFQDLAKFYATKEIIKRDRRIERQQFLEEQRVSEPLFETPIGIIALKSEIEPIINGSQERLKTTR